jgi:hypothetical protein
MKKLLFVISLVLLFLPGCFGGGAQKMIANQKELMSQIPDHTFSKFEYHRGGVYSSAHIVAKGAAKVGESLVIESVNMNLNYGPENLTISLEGYGRDFVAPDKGE